MPKMAPLGSQRVPQTEPNFIKNGFPNVAPNGVSEITLKSVVLGWPEPSKTRLPPARESYFHFFMMFIKNIKKAPKSGPKWHPKP